MYNWPQRKRLRLQNYNYSSNWFYFVTICTKNRENYFGKINNWKMFLNKYWKIVKREILKTKDLRKEINLDKFVIMPNHLHLIIIIDNVETAGIRSLPKLPEWQQKTKNNLSNSIHWIKSSVTKEIRKQFDDFTFARQKSFFDVIIKNDEQLEKTRQYILNNPLKWENDVNNKKNEELVWHTKIFKKVKNHFDD